MTTAWSQLYRLIIILIIVIGLFTGCASVFQDFEDIVNQKLFKSDFASFENALSVYKNGDYYQAMDRFRTLSTAGTNQKLARKAWLGEICCRLILAKTQSDYSAAIGQWRDFVKSAPEHDDAWDLALLDPVIVHMTPKSTIRVIEIHPPAAQDSEETATPADRLQGDQQPNGQQLQPEFAAMEKKAAQAARLQRQLDAVVAENRSLKEKIKALEAIDQNIQKKKTEMAAPSE